MEIKQKFETCVALAQRKAIVAGDFPSAPPKPAPDAMWEALETWRKAEQARHDASAAYNARLEAIRAERERGNWPMSLHLEFLAVGEAEKTEVAKRRELFAALFAPVPASLQKAQTTAAGARQPYVDPDFDQAGNRRYWEQRQAVPSPAVAPEPVAWQYELALYGWSKETYGHWNWHLSEIEPHVPEGSIRNLRPLYASPPIRGDQEAFYTILKKYIPQGPIDQAWQELKEAGLVQ